MNEIEKLNERIEQLTNLVISADETIKSAKEMITLAEQERDRLADQRRDSEPKFERVEYKKQYFGVRVNSEIDYGIFTEIGDMVDNAHFRHNNYFHTKERAQEVTDKINRLLSLERLHDTFCPDFNLGWGDGLNVNKYYVFYSFIYKRWVWSNVTGAHDAVQVYFSTEEIAKKVCDILNAEERSKDV